MDTTRSGSIVKLWVDNNAVGCGVRWFIVVKTGPKWVQLFDPNQLKAFQVERAVFERHAVLTGIKPRRVRAFLRANMRDYRKFKLSYPRKAALAAEAALEGAL